MTSATMATGGNVQSAWDRAQRRIGFWLLLLPIIVMVALYLVPLARLVGLSFETPTGLSLHNFASLWRPSYQTMLLNTLQLSAIVTLLCLVISYPIAYALTFLRGSHVYWIAIALLVTLWLSTLARTYGWVILLQRNGVANDLLMGSGLISARLSLLYNWIGVYIGMVHVLTPFMVVTLVPTMRAIDTNLVRAALSLGAPPRVAFMRVFLPMSLPGVVAGSILVFVMALGFFTTPAILGGGRAATIIMAIRDQVQTLLDIPLAAATSVVLLALTLCILALYEKVVGVDKMFKGR